MIFIVIWVVTIISFTLLRVSSDKWLFSKFWDKVHTVCGAFSVLFLSLGILSTIIIFAQYCTSSSQIIKNEQIYESLMYQIENELYEDDVAKKELVDDITEWNKDLAYYQNIQDDFWLGIFYPNVFDQFEYIPYELIE